MEKQAVSNGSLRGSLRIVSRAALVTLILATTASTAAADNAPIESRFYGDVRLAAEAHNTQSGGAADYGSRIGWQALLPASVRGTQTDIVVHTEFGLADEAYGPDRVRLLYGGIEGDFGRITFGKQWSTFHTVAGQHLDAGFKLSALVYEGAERVSPTLQIAHVVGDTHLQAEVSHDHRKEGAGLNRLQAGASRVAAPWRYGFALDLSKRARRNTDPLSPASSLQGPLCNRSGASCIGAHVGWFSGGLSVDTGIIQALSSDGGATAVAATLQWKPNQWSYYFETSYLDRPQQQTRAAAVGARYRFAPSATLFVEASAARHTGGIERRNETTAAVGLRLEFERALTH